MSTEASQLTNLPAWKALQQHFATSTTPHIKKLFDADASRFDKYSIEVGEIFLDYSKNYIQEDTLALLVDLAEQSNLNEKITALFSGKIINQSEKRAALHTALREPNQTSSLTGKTDVSAVIHQQLEKISSFVSNINNHRITGYDGKPFENIINFGVGGSDLGPHMVSEALEEFACSNKSVHFISNIGEHKLLSVLSKCRPETTLFIVSSKTFTTRETIENAAIARDWLIRSLTNSAVKKHFVAVTANSDEAIKFGIPLARQFEIWDWVGGRYSLWSGIGLSIALKVGMDNFKALLAGAHSMDQHFYDASLEQNMPVLLALTGILNINFKGLNQLAVLPYDERLELFPTFLQQLDMESNGKSVTQDNKRVTYSTGPIVWGGVGTNCQHAFMQLMHQGRHCVPTDFIACLHAPKTTGKQQELLLSNCFAQSKALMEGNKSSAKRSEENHKILQGNTPSNTILLGALTPSSLGSLIALYEHKVFVQGVIWQINSFDQFGVEFGKKLASQLSISFQNQPTQFDSSTNGLLSRCKNNY
ncbi:MAG: hypothetical protein A6F71_06260 [Cycloclasticus sp. symbiont of Poecilosclerida sp. M]|nr:MAG: hypothetical protein A6F71_06260 [Cycloclasticus sp. symbiont of Poecilosclerida sp. M]